MITDLRIPPSERPYPDHRHNCLHFRDGSCGLCIARCPIGALSLEGHDKTRCSQFVYKTAVEAVAERFGTSQTGCGLCQTGVPCQGRIP